MKNALLAIAAVAALAAGTAAHAGLSETATLELTQDGFLGPIVGPSGGTHTFGGLDTYVPVLAPTLSWDASSFATVPGYDRAITLDFTNFDYALFSVPVPASSTLVVSDLPEDVDLGSVRVFHPSDLLTDVATFTSTAGNSFTTTWSVTPAANDPMFPGVVVAWNTASVPTPGALALLGAAGMIGSRRRRR